MTTKITQRLLLFALVQSFIATTFCQDINSLKLKDFHPVSIYKIPETKVEKAKCSGNKTLHECKQNQSWIYFSYQSIFVLLFYEDNNLLSEGGMFICAAVKAAV